MARFCVCFIIALTLAGCSTWPPLEDYALARTALRSARDVGASRYAPGYWHKAEENFQSGEALYAKNDFERAKLSFSRARRLAEKAENLARLERYKSGESYP